MAREAMPLLNNSLNPGLHHVLEVGLPKDVNGCGTRPLDVGIESHHEYADVVMQVEE
jgi:hypothetical protein